MQECQGIPKMALDFTYLFSLDAMNVFVQILTNYTAPGTPQYGNFECFFSYELYALCYLAYIYIYIYIIF